MLRAAAVLFDMDGLLVDSEPLWAEVERDFARVRGGEFTEEMARNCVGKGLLNTLLVMRDAFGFTVDPVADTEEILSRFIARVGDLSLKKGALAFLDAAASKVPIAIGSSSARRLVEATLGRFELMARFSAIVCGDDVAHPKPAPDIWLEASRQLRVPIERCLVLEDSLAGCVAGRAAGAQIIAVPESSPERFVAHADHVCVDLEEALRLVVFQK